MTKFYDEYKNTVFLSNRFIHYVKQKQGHVFIQHLQMLLTTFCHKNVFNV